MAVELQTLIETEIPEGRLQMESSYANLERVAAFCEANYLQASDKAGALEETRRFTVQSLASVAYQVNTLASNLLHMIELQTDKIAEMDSQVNNIAQIVDIHKEKVARREIGVLTTNKLVPRQHKIVAPLHQEKPQRYTRRPIDYSVLDDLGHGVKLSTQSQPGRGTMARTASTASGGSSGSSGGHAPYWLGDPATASHYMAGGAKLTGSQSKATGGKEYRASTMNAPAAGQPQQAGGLQGGPGLTTEQHLRQRYPGLMPVNSAQMQRRSGAPPPASANSSYSAVHVIPGGRESYVPGGVPPPPPPLASIAHMQQNLQPTAQRLTLMEDQQFPPPPSPGQMDSGFMVQHSPPLPPPPPMMMTSEDYGQEGSSVLPEMPQYGAYMGRGNATLPDWVPQNYLEKVVAIYDYQAEKADELSFQENAVIYVLKKNEDQWFEGVLDGVTGLFPGNYVEPCL